jgi:hypothetical protein
VVGGQDHDRLVGEVLLVERVQHRADAVVERARAGLVGGDVAARLGRVGQVRRRQRVERVAHRRRREVLAVGLEEPDRQEERLRRMFLDQSPRRRGDRVDVVVLDVGDVVVAEHAGIAREVLLADQTGPVARVAQRPDQVMAVVVELEAPVREPDHPVRVRPLARKQTRAAAGAGRRGAERLAEQQPLIGEPLDVRRRHRMPVRLHVAPGVVRVDVQDVGLHVPLTVTHRTQFPCPAVPGRASSI